MKSKFTPSSFFGIDAMNSFNVMHRAQTTFNTPGRVDVVTAMDDIRAKTIFHVLTSS